MDAPWSKTNHDEDGECYGNDCSRVTGEAKGRGFGLLEAACYLPTRDPATDMPPIARLNQLEISVTRFSGFVAKLNNWASF
jgi:hypothetical protein